MNIHGEIMNLQPRHEKTLHSDDPHWILSYKIGHRDARHDAAELVTKLEAERDTAIQQRDRLAEALRSVMACSLPPRDVSGQRMWVDGYETLASIGQEDTNNE